MNESTLVPREEMNDLDWLARNVHVWQGAERCVSVCNGVIRWTVGYKPMDGLAWFTKSEWFARRAELQNKPSWDDAPEWATYLSQNSSGEWWWHGDEPTERASLYYSDIGKYMMQCYGEPLGDWRDTLEKRPEEFKPFTSIEDNQEKEMKQDSGWFERGELPPVGVECDIRHSCWNSEKYEKVTVAAITNEYLIVKYATFEQHYMLKDISFRPIRTERDELIEIISSSLLVTTEQVANAILAAGFSMGAK